MRPIISSRCRILRYRYPLKQLSLLPAGALLRRMLLGCGLAATRSLRDEYVVISAHLDHIGTGKPVNGGQYLQRRDGTTLPGDASVIEIAKALAKRPCQYQNGRFYFCLSQVKKKAS